MARHIIFKCPRTGMNVQHRLDDVTAEKSADAYQSVNCPACTLAHFIHRETGKLLGED
jgi:hypothetical protein